MTTLLVFLGGVLVGALAYSMRRPQWEVTWAGGRKVFHDKTSAEAYATRKSLSLGVPVKIHGLEEYVISRIRSEGLDRTVAKHDL
jgi:hypothetical protein